MGMEVETQLSDHIARYLDLSRPSQTAAPTSPTWAARLTGRWAWS